MKKKLSISMISEDFNPAATGVGVHLKLICPELIRRGHRVNVITSRRKGEPETELWNDIRVDRVTSLKMFGFYQALPSTSVVRTIFDYVKPDIVHHHYVGFMMLTVCKVAKSLNLPQIATYHFGAEVLTQPLLMRPFRPLIRSLMVSYNNRFDLLVCPSARLGSQLSAAGIRTPVCHINNPVAFDEAVGLKPAPKPSAFTILYAGRLGPEKNIQFLIKALSAMSAQIPDAALWIAGRGPEEGRLRRLVGELGLNDKVIFLGFIDHATLPQYYLACDVFVLPSLQEVQPMVVIEAMWFGRPVIVTRAIAAADELVDHGGSGYIVDPDSVQDLAGRLASLAASPALRAAQGEAGRRRAETFRPSVTAESLAAAYQSVLGRTPHVK